MEKILISACLLGINCRYDGKNCLNTEILDSLSQHDFVPFCPEVFGGMPTPRKKSGIKDRKTGHPAAGPDVWSGKASVVTEDNEDVTDFFTHGAQECLKTVRSFNVKKAFLKSRSPSCGVNSVSCFGNIKEGTGVCAELLKRNGIEIIEKD
jgi:uncharacterized protein YbbK (DUF523 family)